ncbi:hypothetical protein RRG08_006732 [Elysia crispata]|uniref:Uncharacterized protein n=1 Tax=Elysia crispata TaxID=231223 RepID=A0AAE0YAB3_9GAST|nr:hypothetical protein RRG08_006732 [Elysia crispata]
MTILALDARGKQVNERTELLTTKMTTTTKDWRERIKMKFKRILIFLEGTVHLFNFAHCDVMSQHSLPQVSPFYALYIIIVSNGKLPRSTVAIRLCLQCHPPSPPLSATAWTTVWNSYLLTLLLELYY